MSTKGSTIGRRKFLGMGAAAVGLGLWADLEAYPQNVNRNSIASDLKITDICIAALRGPGGQAVRGANGGPSSVGGSVGVGGPGSGGPPRGQMPPATPGAGAASGGTIVVRIDTNQGISGYGQAIGGGPQPNSLLMHKARLLGENPCNVDRIFRKLKLHGGDKQPEHGVEPH